MKTALFLSLLILSFFTSRSQWIEEFDINASTQKVKTRTLTHVRGYPPLDYTTYYNEKGEALKSESRDKKYHDLAKSTTYSRDSSGRIISAVTIVFNTPNKSAIMAVLNYIKTDTVNTYYIYDSNNKLIREASYTKQNVLYNTVEDSDNGKTKTLTWLDSTGQVTLVNVIAYDDHHHPIKREMTRFEDGKVVETGLQEFVNEYDSEGKLKTRKYKSNSCSDKSTFHYYKNGLVKANYGNKCSTDWRVTYTYH